MEGKVQKRKALPKSIRIQVWLRHVGEVFTAKCRCCFQTSMNVFNYHTAHIVSVARGGQEHLDNLLPTCAQCNLSMGTRNLYEFQKSCGYEQSWCTIL